MFFGAVPSGANCVACKLEVTSFLSHVKANLNLRGLCHMVLFKYIPLSYVPRRLRQHNQSLGSSEPHDIVNWCITSGLQ